MEEDDKALLDAMKALNVPPIKDANDLKKFMEQYGNTQVSDDDVKPEVKGKGLVHAPRISIFYGETDKGEVSYQTWVYEIRCLQAEKTYSDKVLLLGIRRSCRGEAADILRRLGVDATVKEIIDKFESTYGDVETQESILRKFYACQQEKDEQLIHYCARLENIFAQAIEMKTVINNKDDMLRRVFYQGLIPQLKHLSAYKFETVMDYDRLKKEVRKIESELDIEKDEKPKIKTKCQAVNKKEEKKEKSKTEEQLDKMTSLLEKLNSRIEKLENEHQTTTCQQQQKTQAQPTPKLQQENYNEQGHTSAQQQQRYPVPQQQQEQQQYNQTQYNQQQPTQDYQTGSQYDQQFTPRGYGWRGPRHFRGPIWNRPYGRPYRGQGRGSNQYRPTRPTAGTSFAPECYNCHRRGHFARDCLN